MLTRTVVSSVASAVAVAAVLSGCGAPASVGPSVRASAAAPPSTSLAADIARGEIAAALGARSIGVEDARAPYRPAEPAVVAAAPRTVVQAFLPNDPTTGHIVIYEFPSGADAESAGQAMSEYLSSGPGRVNFPPDARFVLRLVGPTLVFYAHAPGSLSDPAAAAAVAEALATVGSEIPVRG